MIQWDIAAAAHNITSCNGHFTLNHKNHKKQQRTYMYHKSKLDYFSHPHGCIIIACVWA